MILSFKERFVPLIIGGTKQQTIREDKGNRFSVGKKIHFWKGNPRNVKQSPFQFGEGIVSEVHLITINTEFDNDIICIMDSRGNYGYNLILAMDGIEPFNEFARKDGFQDWADMRDFFPHYFEGKLITWTDFVECNHNRAIPHHITNKI
jgi:hypothetical protein